MDFLDARPSRQLLYLTACISLLIHTILLLLPASSPQANKPRQRLSVRLAPTTVGAVTPAAPPAPATVIQSHTPTPAAPTLRRTLPAPRPPILTRPEPVPAAVDEPKYSQAQRNDINNFLESLGPTARPRPNAQASLGERSRTMAGDIGREMTQHGDDDTVSVERLPNSPPVDRFTLDFYLNTLLNKLNRNARIMRRPDDGGRKTAAVQLRINPDGTVKSLEVLNEADQKSSVQFIKRLLELSAPYSPFPPGLLVSAKSLAITICIKPGQGGDAAFSSFEHSEGRGC